MLFERHALRVLVPPAGRRLLPFVGRIAKSMGEARAAARDDGGCRPRRADAGSSLETTTALRLSPLLTQFARTYPAVRLAVTAGTTAGLVRDVVASPVDGAVRGRAGRPSGRASGKRLHRGARAGHPSATSTRSRRSRLSATCASWCSRRDARIASGSSPISRAPASSRPARSNSARSTPSSCVSAGVGITLLPRGVLAPAAADGRIAIHRMPRDLARVERCSSAGTTPMSSSAMTAFLTMTRRFHRKR